VLLPALDGRRDSGIAVHQPNLWVTVGGEVQGGSHRLNGGRGAGRGLGSRGIVVGAGGGAAGQASNPTTAAVILHIIASTVLAHTNPDWPCPLTATRARLRSLPVKQHAPKVSTVTTGQWPADRKAPARSCRLSPHALLDALRERIAAERRARLQPDLLASAQLAVGSHGGGVGVGGEPLAGPHHDRVAVQLLEHVGL
jgi:hypothetical protein